MGSNGSIDQHWTNLRYGFKFVQASRNYINYLPRRGFEQIREPGFGESLKLILIILRHEALDILDHLGVATEKRHPLVQFFWLDLQNTIEAITGFTTSLLGKHSDWIALVE